MSFANFAHSQQITLGSWTDSHIPTLNRYWVFDFSKKKKKNRNEKKNKVAVSSYAWECYIHYCRECKQISKHVAATQLQPCPKDI